MPKNESKKDYWVKIEPTRDNRLQVTWSVPSEITNSYAYEAASELRSLGYPPEDLRNLITQYYADITGNSKVPRVIFWDDDTQQEVLEKLRDVICNQTAAQYERIDPRVEEISTALDFGIVKSDSLGFARGEATRAVVSNVFGKSTEPIVYFDEMREYPQFSKDLLTLLASFNVLEKIEGFDPLLDKYLKERFVMALNVIMSQEPLDENALWQKYIEDFKDFNQWRKQHAV